MTTTLNPADKSAGITLSGGNLVAVNNNNSLSGVRALDKQIHGKFYFEATVGPFINNTDAVSVAGYSVPLTTQLNTAAAGTGIVGVMLYQGGAIYYDGSGKGSVGAMSSGTTICVAIDLDAQLAWFKQIGSAGLWDNYVVADTPTGNVGGFSVAAVTAVDIVPFANLTNSGDSVTANFGVSAFAGPVPSGFTAGFPATAGGFTTWSTTDKTNTTLTNGNLTATATSFGFVRAADKLLPAAGKYYWEITIGQSGGNTGFGFCPSALANPTYSNGTCFYIDSGGIYINGGYQGGLPTVNGTTLTIGVALDLILNKVWFRVTPKSLWNGVATADPATGLGGVALNNIGPAYAAAPLLTLSSTNDQITANFGASAFVGAVPSGFSGWASAGVTPVTNAIITDVAIEEWVVGTGVAVMVTAVAVEEWMPNPAFYGGAGQTRAMVMA